MNGALLRLLAGLRDQDVVALLNRGNRGDGLIHRGGRLLLAEAGISCRELRETERLDEVHGDALLVYGAGAMGRGTHTLPRVVTALAPRFAQVILLPCTIDVREPGVRRFVRSWDRKYSVFCRELVTFDSLRSEGATPRAMLLGHDLAFHVDYGPWAARPASGRGGLFRRDNEAAYGRVPRNLAVCEDASNGSDREADRLLDYLAPLAELHTDRCHAAIAAAMMGRKVVMYRNNYFKNRAIYDHSLAGMPNVRFVEHTPFSLRQFTANLYWVRMRPLEMRVRRLFQGPVAARHGG